MKRGKRILILFLAFVLAFQVPVTSYGATKSAKAKASAKAAAKWQNYKKGEVLHKKELSCIPKRQ